MRVVILGCGRVGAHLAQTLEQDMHTVSIIDVNADSFRRLPRTFAGDIVLGTGIDEDVLRRAGLDTADLFIAVTNADTTNIMAAQLAREVFRVPRAIARIYDPARSEIYRSLGLETVCPTTRAVTQLHEMLLRRAAAATARAPGAAQGE